MLRFKFSLRKPLGCILFLGVWIFAFFFFIFMNKSIGDRLYEASALVRFSQLQICTVDGKSLKTVEDQDWVFIVPAETEKIYVCGWVQTPSTVRPTIYLYYEDGTNYGVFYSETSRKVLSTGSFIFDLISKDGLKPGTYRADIYNARNNLASVHFLVEK